MSSRRSRSRGRPRGRRRLRQNARHRAKSQEKQREHLRSEKGVAENARDEKCDDAPRERDEEWAGGAPDDGFDSVVDREKDKPQKRQQAYGAKLGQRLNELVVRVFTKDPGRPGGEFWRDERL